MSLIMVVLPAPFGPNRPTRSPRITRSDTSSRIGRPPKLLPTFSSSATSLPERSPVSTVSLIWPMRSRRGRALFAQVLEALHAAFVARAPRLDTLADPHFFLRPEFLEAPVREIFGEVDLGLALFVHRVIAREGAQDAAIELGDAVRHLVEEAPVVRDDDAGDVPLQQALPASRCRRRRDGWWARRAA